ncbi:MAG TPA: BrnT family toxin [Hyphomicrobiales bacterium]|nr:BrnT family toxin [Hyphomicrobiales bacterium]
MPGAAKRPATLAERGLDFRDAARMFAGRTIDWIDDRQDYGERGYVSAGFVDGRMMIVVWTPRGEGRRVISMSKANGREQKRLAQRFAEE